MSDPGPRKFKAVLFDLYDTLVWLDIERSDEGRQRLADRLGVPLNLFLQVWRRSIDDRMLGKGSLAQHLAETAKSLGMGAGPTLIEELIAIEHDRLKASVHLYPNSVPVLKWLAGAGYRLALVSNVSDGAATPITHLGLDQLFRHLILSHEVGVMKPDPAIFLLACQRLEVKPEEAMFVADGGFGELDAAHLLGIFTVKLEQEWQSKDFGFSTSYDTKIEDLWQLRDLLDPAGK